MKDVILLPNINLYSPFFDEITSMPSSSDNSSVSTIDLSMSKNWVWPTLSGASRKDNTAEKQPESSPGGFC